MPSELGKKQELLAAELFHYFGETCPALVASWQTAIAEVAPALMGELTARTRKLNEATEENNRQLRAALRLISEEGATQLLVDQALLSFQHLEEIASEMMRRLDEMLATA